MEIGVRSEKFQEAFERFEQVVDVDKFESYKELLYAFERWADPTKWIPTDRQLSALAYEAEIRGFRDTRIPKYFRRVQVYARQTWRHETVTVRGKSQVRYRDLKTGRFIKKP